MKRCLLLLLGLCACGRSTLDPSLLPTLEEGGSSGGGGRGGSDSSAGASTGARSGGSDGGGAGGRGGGGSGGLDGGGGTGGAGELPFPSFVSFSAPRDVVHDEKRGLLYISSDAGLFAYDPNSEFFARLLEKSVMGIALSPDQDTLIATDEDYVEASASTLATNFVHVLDLENGDVTDYEFADEYYEAGTFMPAFLDDSQFLLSSSYPGSGWAPLRRVRVSDGSYEILGNFNQDTALVPSADGSVIAYAETNISSGPFGFYRLQDGSFHESETDWFLDTIGVSRSADQYAVPTYSGLHVYDGELGKLTVLGEYVDRYATAVVYSPKKDEMYVAWDGDQWSLEVLDTTSFESLEVLDKGKGFGSSFPPGALRISRDGTLLFASEYSGIHIYRVGD